MKGSTKLFAVITLLLASGIPTLAVTLLGGSFCLCKSEGSA